MAIDRACWQGEPVVAVVAKTRAEAEDALQYVQVEWEALPAALDMNTALDPATPVIHPELGDNLCFTRSLDTGGVDEAVARGAAAAAPTLSFAPSPASAFRPASPLAPHHPSHQWHLCDDGAKTRATADTKD